MLRTLWLSVVLVAAVSWANPPQTFSQGSLIIPMQANFQNECAMASAYGLVWKILYENRAGGAFAGAPVTVYWAIQGSKTSTNRCVPTNKHAGPQDKLSVGIGAGKNGWDTGVMNDGCDFFVENPGRQPVVPVDWGVAWPALNIYSNNTIPQFDSAAGSGQPGYNTAAASPGKGMRPATLDNSGVCAVGAGDALPCGATRFTKVQYSGGAFVIDAADAKRVIDAINNAGIPHMNQHKSTTNTQCGGLGSGGASQGTFSSVTGAGGQVLIHQATASFDAPIYKRITNTPPRIALVDFGGGTKSVLLSYLTRAQLQGDASGNIGGTKVCGTPGAVGGLANCPVSTTGLIYDRIRGLDDLLTNGTMPKGLINTKLGGKSRYKVIWAPHWELDNSDKSSGAATAVERGNALDNLDYFGDQKGNGLLAECASIEGYEGSSSVTQYSATGLGKFMFNGNIRINGMTNTKNGRNCTDPWYVNGMCTKYAAPADPFSQVGDYTYVVGGGHVESFTTTTAGVESRKTNVKRLASSWENFPAGADNTGDNGWDYATLRQKDDDPEKATVIYVAGHDLSSDPAGTRIVLNTLLNLGADPIPSDRNYTSATGFIDVTNANSPTFLTSIYSVVSGTLLPGAITYDKTTGKNWMWPFTGGNVRIRNPLTLASGENELTDSIVANADAEMPLPNNRNLFTYFGGYTQVNPALSGGRKVRNGVAQLGWVPERIEYNRIDANYGTAPNPVCVDVQQWGDYKDKVTGVNTSGLIPGPDGICDLQQAMVWSNFAWVTGGTGNHTIPPGHLNQLQTEVPEVQQFIQRVRGYCFATKSVLGLPIVGGDEIMQPTDPNCVDMGGFGDNRAHIGGAVRSSSAVVPPSPKIADAGAARPTVAYVGTWDGQLHAIYIGGGAGYTGPAAQRPHLNADAVCTAAGTTSCSGGAVNTFKTNFAANFAASTLPNRGTELWSFMPASQLAWLKTNSAKVDSSPVVQDVFVDLYGTGLRAWHTILVVSLGGTGREIFAFDVTNPLKPALLWDIVGSTYQVGAFPDYSGVARSDFDITGAAVPYEWNNTTADFLLPPAADPGRGLGYAYDFADLGGSRSLSIGQMREGLEPTYAVFVASNASGAGAGANDAQGRNFGKGINVFALDIATGQKIWQWKQPYVVDNTFAATYRSADNTVPPPVAVLNTAEGAGMLYVGDMEGRVWELNATTGQNLNALRDATCTTAACNYPLFDTRGTAAAPEPISSNLAIARLPISISAGTPLKPYANEVAMLIGTGGADWVPGTVAGNLHSVLLNSARRKPVKLGVGPKLDNTASGFHATAVWDMASVRASAASGGAPGELGGVAQDPVGMPLSLGFSGANGKRVYGTISVAGQTAYVPLVTGAGSDPMAVAKDQAGSTLRMDLGNMPASAAGAAIPNFNYANYGGVAVFETGAAGSKTVYAVGDETGKTAIETLASGTAAANNATRNPALNAQPTVPYRLYNAVRRFFSQQ